MRRGSGGGKLVAFIPIDGLVVIIFDDRRIGADGLDNADGHQRQIEQQKADNEKSPADGGAAIEQLNVRGIISVSGHQRLLCLFFLHRFWQRRRRGPEVFPPGLA